MTILLALATMPALAQVGSPVAPATQTEVNAGTVTRKYVSPATLSAWTGAGTNGSFTTAISNSLVAGWTAADVVVSNGLYRSSEFRVRNYGGTNLTTRLYDTRATNGSAVIYSASAAFTSADVGKMIRLYKDATNMTFFDSTISSVTSATQITMNASSPITFTGQAVYGNNNFAAVTNAYNAANLAGGGTVLFDAGEYLISGPYQSDGYYDSVFKLPATFIRGSATNRTVAIEFMGAYAPVLSVSSQSNGPSETGTILYMMATNNPASGRPQALFAHNYPGDKALEQYTFRNLVFRQPVRPQLSAIYCEAGGGLIVENCVADVDYPRNYLTTSGLGTTNQFVPTFNVYTNYITGFRFPTVANNSDSQIRNCMVFGYEIGYVMGEHTRGYSLNAQYCGGAFGFDASGSKSGPQLKGGQALCCRYGFVSMTTNTVVSDSYESWVQVEDVELELHDWVTSTIYNPGKNLRGRIHFLNDQGTNVIDSLLEVKDGTLRTKTETGTLRVTGDIASAAGFDLSLIHI
jgi:hypothetical protein